MRAETRTPLGIVLNHTPAFAATQLEADRRAARLDDGLNVRWYMDPVFRAQYPADVMEHLGADAPRIEPGDLAEIAQPLDFLGVNFYTAASSAPSSRPSRRRAGRASPTWAGRSTPRR
jgi:beta-glucosidase